MVERHVVVRRAIATLMLCCGIVGCGETSSVTATCALGPEFESSVVAADASFDNFSQTTPRQLQSTMSVLLLSLSRMRDVAPTEISTQLEDVDRAYSEVSIALQSIAWETAIADSDPLVDQSLQVLSRGETIEAMGTLRDFFSTECKTELKALPALANAGATTLPSPVGQLNPDAFVESSPDFDTEESALRAYGYYVADQIGEEIDDAAASCLGSALVDAAERSTPLTEAEYDAFVIEAIAKCVG